MKILILYPHDLAKITTHGSGKKIFNYLKYFSNQGHQLYLAGFDNGITSEDTEILKKYAQLLLVPPITGLLKKINPFALFLTGKLNRTIYSKELQNKINQCIKEEKIDLVHLEFTAMGEYYLNLSPGNYKKTFFNDEVVLRKYLLAKKEASSIIQKKWINLQIPKIKKYEKRLYQHSDLIITITEKEKQFVQAEASKKNIVVSNYGLNIDRINPQPIPHESFNLLFVGNYLHQPNKKAAQLLVQQIFPKIKEKIPNAQLYLVGPNPPNLEKIPGIKICGFVKNLNEYYNLADLFVAPLFTGGGLRVKIIEALAMGKKVITTPLGKEGIDLDLNVAKNTDEFVQQIIECYENKNYKNNSEQVAIIKDRYNYQKIYQTLEKNYLMLVANNSG